MIEIKSSFTLKMTLDEKIVLQIYITYKKIIKKTKKKNVLKRVSHNMNTNLFLAGHFTIAQNKHINAIEIICHNFNCYE